MVRSVVDVLAGGRVGDLVRTKDWSKTELGAMNDWPQGLVNVVSLVLNSRFPLIVYWGPNLNVIYNDAYVDSSDIDVATLGKPCLEVWPDAWHLVHPGLELVFSGKAVCSDDRPQTTTRSGVVEDCYFMWSYSPLRDEDGSIHGALAMNTETTARVISERRLNSLSMLSYLSQDVSSVAEACSRAVRVMHEHTSDIAFALFYLTDATQSKVVLQDAAGIERSHAAAVQEIALDAATTETRCWPVARAVAERRVVLVYKPESLFGPLPGGQWHESPKVAAVCPIVGSTQDMPAGVLVIGINPHRPVDEECRVFIDLLSRQVAHNVSVAETRAAEHLRVQASSERLQSAFFSNISQELRTPLTLILGPLEHVLTDPDHILHREYKDRVALAHRNATRLLKLVNSLLDFSRIQAGHMSLTFSGVKLGRLTADLASVFRPGFEAAGLEYVVDTDAVLETVFVDLDLWEKVVFNLLCDAFKYTTAGKITVCMKSTEATVELDVSDTGCGIPDSDLPHIFERFYAAAHPNARTYADSGIGLALSLEIVKMHGGTMTAQTVPGRGTTFTVSLPRGTAHLPAERVNYAPVSDEVTGAVCRTFAEEAWRLLRGPSGVGAPTPALSTQKRPRILVVVHNPDMQQYMSDLLAGLYDVDVASDGKAALEHIDTATPDLVVADAILPRLGGLELVKDLRVNPATQAIPFLVMSSSTEHDVRIESLQAGADDYIVTPVATSDLLLRVRTQLQISGLRGEVDRLVRQRASASLASEKRFHTLAQLSPVGMFLANAEGHVLFFNNKWANIMQLHSLAEADEWLSRVHPDDHDTVKAAWAAALHDHVPIRLEFQYRRFDGPSTWIWVFAQSMPDVDESGAVRGVVMSFTDMTESKQHEEEKMDFLRDAEAMQRGRAELAVENRRVQELFVDRICHEIRNPLNGMINNLELLRDNILARRELLRQAPADLYERLLLQADDDEALIAVLDLCMNHQQKITNDVLHISKLQAGQITLDVDSFDPATLVKGVVSMARAQSAAKGIALSIVLPEPEMPHLRGDSHRISQIIINLLSNAVKFTAGCNRPEITVTAKLVRIDDRPEATLLKVSVADTGIGMTVEEQASLFQRFTQANVKTHSRYGGSGLGLFLSKIIVERMGGQITLTSARDQGTTVTFTVVCEFATSPVQSPSATEMPVAESVAEPAVFTDVGLVPMLLGSPTIRVLVVEDNDVNQAVLKRQLESAASFKCDVKVADNGVDALAVLEHETVDLVLMDVFMPVMDGCEATKRIREREAAQHLSPLPIIGLSGNARQGLVDLAMASGMTDYVVKPYNKKDLLGKVFANTHRTPTA